jgi:hypothetical protein
MYPGYTNGALLLGLLQHAIYNAQRDRELVHEHASHSFHLHVTLDVATKVDQHGKRCCNAAPFHEFAG